MSFVAAGVLVAATACTGSNDVVDSGGTLVLQLETTGSSGRYDTSEWSIQNLAVQPVDPLTQDALGGQVLSFGATPLPLDLAASTPSAVTTVNLGPGTYEIVSIRLLDLYLRDESGPVAEPQNCAQGKTAIPMGAELFFEDLPTSSRFTITANGSHTLAVRLDLDEIVRRAEEFYFCFLNPCFTVDPPRGSTCVSTESFRQNFIPDVMTIEQVR